MARLYRFRSIDRLLGESKELDKQEIYFASPSELNDPTEGFRPIVWRGDSIVWTNLFRHYMYCIHWTCIRFALSPTGPGLREDDIPVNWEVDLGITPELTRLHELAVTRLSKEANLAKVVNMLAKPDRSVREIDLLFFLRLFHLSALQEIKEVHLQLGHTIPHLPDTRIPHLLSQFLNVLEQAAKMDQDNATDVVLKISARLTDGVFFGGKFAINLKLRNQLPDPLEENLRYLYYDFPRAYIEKLTQLLYPNWYAAGGCFSRDCTNAVTWASYGDEHRGVCLVFESVDEPDRQVLPLKISTRFGAQAFHDVNYGPNKSPIDFFRSIGRLPYSEVTKKWYSDGKGNTSECGSHLGANEDSWRKEYWKQFLSAVAQKSVHWQHERETRLILYGSQGDLSGSERTATYEFSSLVEVIFGIRTPDSEKMDVIEVIRKKCGDQGRDNFKFSQAYYSREKDCIEKYKLIHYRKSE